MPKTQQPASERRARVNEKDRQNEAVYEAQSDTRQGEEQGYEKLQNQKRVLSGDSPEELFPTGTPPGADPGVLDTIDESAVSPGEQREYNQIVTKGAKFIYSNPEKVLAAINDTKVPIHQGVGRVLANIGTGIENSAKAAGVKLSPDVMFHAGNELAAVILDLGIESGILPLDPKSEEYQKILGMSLMEASKAFGERMISDPKKAPLYKEEAENAWAFRVSQEVAEGKADPRYLEMTQQRRGPVAAGVNKALGNVNG